MQEDFLLTEGQRGRFVLLLTHEPSSISLNCRQVGERLTAPSIQIFWRSESVPYIARIVQELDALQKSPEVIFVMGQDADKLTIRFLIQPASIPLIAEITEKRFQKDSDWLLRRGLLDVCVTVDYEIGLHCVSSFYGALNEERAFRLSLSLEDPEAPNGAVDFWSAEIKAPKMLGAVC